MFNRNVARKKADWVPAGVAWSENADEVLASNVDVVVELAGGLDPAGNWVRRAIEAGKSVVTAALCRWLTRRGRYATLQLPQLLFELAITVLQLLVLAGQLPELILQPLDPDRGILVIRLGERLG